MSITTEQGLLDKYNTWAPTAAEITAWKVVTKHADANTIETKAGLFGVTDLTKFLEECETLTWCKVDDYENYTGWAVGVAWTPATATANTQTGPFGVAFNTWK